MHKKQAENTWGIISNLLKTVSISCPYLCTNEQLEGKIHYMLTVGVTVQQDHESFSFFFLHFSIFSLLFCYSADMSRYYLLIKMKCFSLSLTTHTHTFPLALSRIPTGLCCPLPAGGKTEKLDKYLSTLWALLWGQDRHGWRRGSYRAYFTEKTARAPPSSGSAGPDLLSSRSPGCPPHPGCKPSGLPCTAWWLSSGPARIMSMAFPLRKKLQYPQQLMKTKSGTSDTS